MTSINLSINHFYICVAVTHFLIVIYVLATIFKCRNQIFKITSVGEIIKLAKPNIHVKSFLNINPGQIPSIHIPQLLEISYVSSKLPPAYCQ